MEAQTKSNVQWDPIQYDTKHSYVPRHGADVLKLLDPQRGERILDLGCGTGHLTAEIAASGAFAMGLDAAPAMIEQARTSYPHIDFVVADAASFTFDQGFDAVISNAALHWIAAEAQLSVAACIARALRPGGRFVAELGGKGNVRLLIAALREATAEAGYPTEEDASPWCFPSVGEYASLLEASHLEVVRADLFDRPTPLDAGEDGIREWIRMFGTDYVAHVPTQAFDEVVEATERRLRAAMYQNGVWYADYRRLRIVALKES